VEEEVSRAVGVLLRADAVSIAVAGRTDTGVHATGQVASYPASPVPVSGLNALLPDDVTALACSKAPEDFDARRNATSRAYCYRVLARSGRSALLRGRALHWPHPIDFDALSTCATALVGTHDFTAFTPTETDHVRFSRDVHRAFWRRAEASSGCDLAPGGPGSGDLLEFWIEADAFMRHMNRILVGTMLEVSSGRRSLASFRALLAGQPRRAAGPTAPAHGLYLAGVGYGQRVLRSQA
jgi:tRNA pseudouridine38-40 synthase